jgi:hypothetical protein
MLTCSLVGWPIARADLVNDYSSDYQKRGKGERSPNKEEAFEDFPCAIHFSSERQK